MEPERCQKYQIFWIIKLQLLQKVFTGNMCYCSYIWHAQLIRSVFQLNVSFSCWFRSIRVPFFVFCSLLNFYQGCQRTRTLWNWCLHSGRSLSHRWQVVAIYHNSQLETTQKSRRLLSNWSVRISRVSVFRLKELYCTSWDEDCHDIRYIETACIESFFFFWHRALNKVT